MTIFFSVGEPSGDLHGANLIRALGQRRPQWQFVGYGGPKMAAAGCQLHADLTKLAVMWIARVLVNLHKFIGLLVRADSYFRDYRPDAVVLIDYPGFNWWIARRAKVHGIPVFYYGRAASVGLGEPSRGEDAAARGPCAVQAALRGAVVWRTRLPRHLCGTSLL